MTEVAADTPPVPRPPAIRERGRLRWWKEALYIAAFYGVYSVIRNTQGSATVSAAHALDNARHLIRLERAVGVFHEQAVQKAFLGWRAFIQLALPRNVLISPL